MKNKEKEETKKVVKNLLKSERGRAVLFFLFYFVFFLVIILMARTNLSNNRNNDTKNESNASIKADYDLKKLEAGNYRFTREETRNGAKTIFTGEANNGRSSFLMTTDIEIKNFFSYNDIYLEKENNSYKVSVNPYLYPRLNDYSTIKKILDTAHLKSKTTYENGNTIYQYEISSTTLLSIMDNKEVDLDDQVNLISLTTDENKNIVEIIYQLDSYHSYNYNVVENLTIKIDYSAYGKVKELEIPG